MREREDMNVWVVRKMEKKSKEKGEAEKTRQEEEEEEEEEIKKNKEKKDGERVTVKGLPHEQVPQPGRDFSSEALENLPNPK